MLDTAIKKAKKEGLHSDLCALVVIVEQNPSREYGFGVEQINPYTTNCELVCPLGLNAEGQQEYLISVDTAGTDDPTHPDPGTPAGWSWRSHGKVPRARRGIYVRR